MGLCCCTWGCSRVAKRWLCLAFVGFSSAYVSVCSSLCDPMERRLAYYWLVNASASFFCVHKLTDLRMPRWRHQSASSVAPLPFVAYVHAVCLAVNVASHFWHYLDWVPQLSSVAVSWLTRFCSVHVSYANSALPLGQLPDLIPSCDTEADSSIARCLQLPVAVP